jgi:hypothetical protein
MTKTKAGLNLWRGAAVALISVLAGGSAWAAPTVKIIPRPLTPREVQACPSGTRTASGLSLTGVGQPLYLEALVTTGTVVNSVTWNLIAKPTSSLAVLQASPVTNSLPTYDGGDQRVYNVANRQMLVPDVISEAVDEAKDIWNDYVVSVQLNVKVTATSNTNITVTNKFACANYVGANICALCHDDKMAGFNSSAHATAFTRKIDGGLAYDGKSVGTSFTQSCYVCHSVGYDTNSLANNAGFDDIARTSSPAWIAPTSSGPGKWGAMPLGLQNKANVQCESCHGPGGRHIVSVFATDVVPNYTNSIGISLSSGNCGQCHDAPNGYMKNYEWGLSAHGMGADAFKSPTGSEASCSTCHSGEGRIATNDVDYISGPLPRGTGNEGIACATCHDPHGPGMNGTHQLRYVASVTLSNGVVNTLGGKGLVCMQCHRARKNGPTYVDSMGSVSRWGPHHSPQADMLIGTNAIEYSMVMPRSKHLTAVQDTCVDCHMQPTPTSPASVTSHVGGHTFRLHLNDGTNDVQLTTTCTTCHGTIANFNFGGEDWNRNGVIEGVQSEIQGLMNSVAKALPPYGSTNMPVPATSWTLKQRRAAYNYMFVWEDKSLGVHNPKYAAAILQASLDDLSSVGIDVNRDGLPDSWQNQYYGSFTNSSAAPGADPLSKGLTNLQNYQLGLNPTKLDTDGDGYADAVELQSGSDPLNSGSTPTQNMVTILPALELAYLPGTNGVSMHFQAIDTLAGGSWTNVGAGFISSTNTWFYQLISPRGSKQQSFRVTTP